jgi:HEAT repeat protein
MDWSAQVEIILSREQAAGRLTRQEAELLQHQLSVLAFNMTAAGQPGLVPKTVAAAWLVHLRTRNLSSCSQARSEEQAHAARWWSAGETAGFLRTTESSVAFAEGSLQTYFCAHFCRTRPFDALLLRLAARDSFKEAWHLWAEQDPSMVEQLIAWLKDAPQRHVRFRAAKVLSYLADPRALDPLIAALNDPSGGVRVMAAQALLAIGDPRAIEPINKRLKEEPASLHTPLIEVLGHFGAPALPVLLRLLEVQEKTIARPTFRALSTLHDPQALRPLFNRLGHQDPLSDVQAASILAGFGEPGLLLLLQALQAPDWRVRLAAASGLRRGRGGGRAIEPLLRVLRKQREHPYVLQQAYQAVVEGEDIGQLDLLMSALSEQPPLLAACAAEALGKLGDRRAVAPLLRVLQTASPTLPSLRQRLLPTNFWFRYRHHWPKPSWLFVLRLLDIHPTPDLRVSVIEALGRLHDPQAVEPLLFALQHPQARVRAKAAQALGNLDASQAVEPLINALQDQVFLVREAAASAVGHLGERAAIEPLLTALHTTPGLARRAMIHALGHLGASQAVEPLLQLLNALPWAGTDQWVGQAILETLGHLRDRRAVEPLLPLLQETDPRHRSAIKAVGQLGDSRAVDPLLLLLESRNSLTRLAAVQALGLIGDRRALRPLVRVQQTQSARSFFGRPIKEAATAAIERIKRPLEE